jgi:hypothetical protein
VSNLDERAMGTIRTILDHLMLTVFRGIGSAIRRHNAGAISQESVRSCSPSPIGLGVAPKEICLCLDLQMNSGYGIMLLHKMAGVGHPTGSPLRWHS